MRRFAQSVAPLDAIPSSRDHLAFDHEFPKLNRNYHLFCDTIDLIHHHHRRGQKSKERIVSRLHREKKKQESDHGVRYGAKGENGSKAMIVAARAFVMISCFSR